MNKTVFLGTILALAGGALVIPVSASAAKIGDITCEQFLAMDEGARSHAIYWINGADAATSNRVESVAEVDVGMDAFGRPVDEIVTACEGEQKASLWEKIKSHF